MSTYGAHIFKRAQRGEREEVRIKLFGSDGEPLILGEPVELPEGLMVFRGAWNALEMYKQFDVVTNGGGSYIFNEDVDPNAAPVFKGATIDKVKTGAWAQFSLTINADSPKGDDISNVAGSVPFDAFVFRLSDSGYLDLVFQSAGGGNKDQYGKLYKQNGNNWDFVSNHDDESSNGYPGVYWSGATAGVYLFALTTKGGDVPAAYGATNVFRGGAPGQATYAPLVAFPTAKVTQLG